MAHLSVSNKSASKPCRCFRRESTEHHSIIGHTLQVYMCMCIQTHTHNTKTTTCTLQYRIFKRHLDLLWEYLFEGSSTYWRISPILSISVSVDGPLNMRVLARDTGAARCTRSLLQGKHRACAMNTSFRAHLLSCRAWRASEAVIAGYLGCMATSHSVHIGPIQELAVVHAGCRACTSIHCNFFCDAEMHMCGPVRTKTHTTHSLHTYTSFTTKKTHRQASLNTWNLSISHSIYICIHTHTYTHTGPQTIVQTYLHTQHTCTYVVWHTHIKVLGRFLKLTCTLNLHTQTYLLSEYVTYSI